MLNDFFVKNARRYSISEIEKFEFDLNCKLSLQYKQFLIDYGAGIPSKSEIDFFSEMVIDNSLTITDFLNLEQISIMMSYNDMKEYILQEGCIIIADASYSSLAICIGVEEHNTNQIFLMNSESYLEKIFDTFNEFINSLY